MRRTPLSAALLFVLASPAAFAQTAPAPAPAAAKEASTLDTIVVTGTRVSDRTVAESQSPIDIITPETLQATGTTELATALSRALPSLNFPRPAITDGTDAVRPAQIRGLAPDQVLVLVNGKRRHTTALINLNGSIGRGSSPVDLNAIPISAIERVEVLRDGASAQYGSDAIAGVINVVLKGRGSDGGVSLGGGKFSAGDGEQWNANGHVGIEFGDKGFLRLAAQGGHQDQTNRARPYRGVVEQRYGDPEIDSGALFFNTEYAPAEGVNFYAFGGYNKSDVLSNGYFRPADDYRNTPSIYPNGFLPQIHNISENQSAVAGVRGTTAGGTNIDVSLDYGRNYLDFNIENTLNTSLGPTSPTKFYAGALKVTQNVLNLDFSKSLDVGMAYPITLAYGAEWRGEKFEEKPGEPGSYAKGTFVSPNETQTPPRIVPGAQVFAGFTPGDSGSFHRESYAFYVDLEADFNEKFSAGIAARYEDYSDFGDTTSGKLSARYAFTDKVALRGTISTGFRAPSLQQQYFQSVATNFIGGLPYEIATFRVDNPAAKALGAEALKAEESTNYGLGLVLQPIDALYITIDAYRIDIDDRILLSENLISPAVRAYLQSLGYSVAGGRYFTNAADTKTTGIDIVGTYRWQLDAGTLDFTAGYNYSKTEIRSIAKNPAALEAIDPNAVRIGRTEISRITEGAPRDKFMLGGTWNSEHWQFSATATRYGEFTWLDGTTPVPIYANDQTFGAKWTLDLAATYKLGDWSFTLGGDNVLDEYPDESRAAVGSRNYLPYNTQSPFGFNGAYVYGKVGYKW
ncbi:TonB-dependent receptor plug domain-containing protein [Luteimonas aquatica]|uniref:TonB-dependent receptor plug domain-containing protein n=1 Tax=Luteimonas aquatica TaxID=450364 RepID=UPI001F55D895|nr:TonB-dependent receptor [Luteimonas aquatica]